MDFHEHLKELSEIIERKQKEREINENLARICKELDSYSTKISNCLSENIDLPKTDVEKIHSLNDEYNDEFKKFKNLK